MCAIKSRLTTEQAIKPISDFLSEESTSNPSLTQHVQRTPGARTPTSRAQPPHAQAGVLPADSTAEPAQRRSRQEPTLASRALRALTRREYTATELRRKLAPFAASEEELHDVLSSMQAKGFLSDARATESLVRQKSARLGNTRLRQELQAKGVDKELLETTLASLQDSEWERAKSIWHSKFGSYTSTGLDWKERQKQQAKQIRFMISRGFSADIVRKLLHDSSD